MVNINYTQKELECLCKALSLWEELLAVLGDVEAYPRSSALHIASEIEPGYLGWFGYGDDGGMSFHPNEEEKPQ